MPVVNGQYRRPQLRNKAINYRFGWFFVTFQVAGNKSELGAIVGETCVLNKLGLAVKELIETLPKYNPEVYVDCFVVMPNHVHLVLKIAREARGDALAPQDELTGSNLGGPNLGGSTLEGSALGRAALGGSALGRAALGGSALEGAALGGFVLGGLGRRPQPSPTPENRLAKIMMKLKSLAAREYRLLKERGEARDIGPKLWQANYWEKIVTNYEQLESIRAYIANNPKRWSTDRFGPVTTYSQGNLALLNEPFVGFVASQEARGGALAPQEYARAGPTRAGLGRRPQPDDVVISTFTSPQEREVLRRLLAKGRRFIAVYPGGIPTVLSPAIAASVEAGRALLVSPVTSGTGVNKQRAVWCNEYVIRRAQRIWCGDITPGGTLESILKGVGRKPNER